MHATRQCPAFDADQRTSQLGREPHDETGSS